MILVLSFDTYEQGTDPVIDWLIYFNAPFIRISIFDLIKKDSAYTLDFERQEIFVNGRKINDLINVVWYRRFYYDYKLDNRISTNYYNQFNDDLKSELNILTEFLAKVFKNKKWMPSFNGYKLNKLEELTIAKEVGWNVPKTIITNNRKDLLEFCSACADNIITKAFGKKSYYIEKETTYCAFTKSVDKETISKLDEFFFPSFFQEKIASDFEIRVFALDKKFFATASLYSEEMEEPDIKMYSSSSNFHAVPYSLSPELEQLLERFMLAADLNTGSFDIIKSKEGLYYFLEVNPVGQYLLPSFQCNFYIEKEIAEWLIQSNIHG